nr:mitochondrial ribonuclease P protein 3 [Leptinotarsa decemlineata]
MFNKRIFSIFSKCLHRYSSYLGNNAKFQPREKFHFNIVENVMKNIRIDSIQEWHNVRQAIMSHEYNRGQYNANNVDAVILGHCTSVRNYDLGSSYISFLKQENIKRNVATRSKYLKLLYYMNEQHLKDGKRCPKEQEELILKHYNDLREEFPILDSFTLENAVTALCLTSQWKKCLELMKEIEISTVPNQASYSALISAAFVNEEEDMAWQLLNEMLANNRTPLSICFLTYLGTLRQQKKKEKLMEKLEMLFSFFQESDYMCDQETAKVILNLCKGDGFRNKFTSITYQGVCKNCLEKLDYFDLKDEEFDDLKDKLFKNVIIGKDVFVKTNPEELQKFTRFVEDMGKFDVVLDGLNVAYTAGTRQPPQVLSGMVAAVVSHFVNQNKNVLVLGRVHMNNWPRTNWRYINEHATVFLTQNISQDDPYLLYCALNSGKDTIIVTRDLMRGHKFLLKNPKDKILFNRWLTQRQYQFITIKNSNKPIFRIPPQFSQVSQKNGTTWHIPFVEEGADNTKNEFHKTWLCFKIQ